MIELERTVEEKASAKRRARHYVEDHRVSKWSAVVQALLLFGVITGLAFAIAFYALGAGERDNENYKKEQGQQPVFETQVPEIEFDRSIKAYDDMAARHGVKR
jgi:hypothetical protein